ncbi:MAG TPA: sigma-54 dependent transcriptional regulator, partial [Acidobacteriota bacterium]|nr:sigma-54 dependent transcriptional regulator [Acidobacteriota bacterium]
EPLEEDLLQVDDQSVATPALLSRIREFSDRMMEPRTPDVLAERMVKTIGRSVPGVSARFYLRQRGGAYRQVARFGRVGRLDRGVLEGFRKTNDQLACESFGFPGNPRALIYLLAPGPQLSGLLYVEKKSAPVFASESSFIAALGSIYCSAFSSFVPSPQRAGAQGDGLQLPGGGILIGRHPLMQALFLKIRQAAASSVTVLIHGESGTGKELVARGVHQFSSRASRPFVPINCAALPEHLIEAELFGYEKGSFTGADQRRIGLVEAADGGTLFLDELSAMPLASQARLLRTIQEKSIRRIGEMKERPVDVRIVAASNQDLRQMARDGRFREDLYHRLNVFPIHAPPLRDRIDDIRGLVVHFLEELNRKEEHGKQLSRSALSFLEQHSFPGNVRELQNLVESLFYTASGKVITARDVVERLPVNDRVLQGWQGRSRARAMLEELREARADFWVDVRDAFLDRELSRGDVRELIREGLKLTRGNYKELLQQLRLPASDYKKFLAFLTNHRCKVDFRPYRRGFE